MVRSSVSQVIKNPTMPFGIFPHDINKTARSSIPTNIAKAASQAQTPVSLRSLMDFGSSKMNPGSQALLSAQWLYRELPIRFAHRIQEIYTFPHKLAEMPSVMKVQKMYEQSFTDIQQHGKPANTQEEASFSTLLDDIYQRHTDVVRLIAKGCIELRQNTGQDTNAVHIRSFLDRFYMSRIGIRMLIAQHLSLRDTTQNKHYIGVIRPNCNPANVARDAIDAARNIAYRSYGDAPEVLILGDKNLTFPYVESHVFLCLFELIKNSIRATLEYHEGSEELPPVKVIIADGTEDITVKVDDAGGGISRAGVKKMFTYLYSTAPVPPEKLLTLSDEDESSTVLAGYGYGIPLTRLYARYFGGDLTIVSMDGYGTDAYLHLCKLGDQVEAIH